MQNRYKKVAHFSESKFRHIIKCFCLDLTATDTANLCGLSRNSINKIFVQIRQRILFLPINSMKKKNYLVYLNAMNLTLAPNGFGVNKDAVPLEKLLCLDY